MNRTTALSTNEPGSAVIPGEYKTSSVDLTIRDILPGYSGVKHIHPMFVHFPIALLPTAFVFALLSWTDWSDDFVTIAEWLFILGTLSLPIVATTGFLAIGGWGSGHVVDHRNLMLLTTILSITLLFAYFSMKRKNDTRYRLVLTLGLGLLTLTLTLGADRGAWLVFVEGAGVKPAEHVHDHGSENTKSPTTDDSKKSPDKTDSHQDHNH